MRRLPSQTQAEVENDDEAAEAAELCRMLMDDDEAERKKKKKAKSGDTGLVSVQQSNHNFKKKDKLKGNSTAKPMTRPDGSFSINQNAVKFQKDQPGWSLNSVYWSSV
ncbi:uncharacterized protein [Rutidosis leptorrhynchoides]|uniref:uncharacterized protein isoform X2 n=1 Tax=Rutidosis leptorrhynchoides TaxID=125765 RepID=UPI003A98FE55